LSQQQQPQDVRRHLADEFADGHPNHPVKLQDLLVGKFTELPLRDPLTMQPLK
jgi:hypothetical protein